MDFIKFTSLVIFALFALSTFYSSTVEACMCMPSHPQTHFCTADYVIMVRVLRKSHRLVANNIAYKVEIKKSYKMNPEAHKMLKHGRLLTADSDSMCGVTLEIGRLYVIAARAAQLNTCAYIKEYMKMSVIERRGFYGVYRKGCKCQIKPCFSNRCVQNYESNNSCRWSPLAKCETDYSACMPASHNTPEGLITKCHWRRTPAYKACMADP